MERFHLGKRTKVFTYLQILVCDPKENRQKNVLSTFVISCLEPYVLILGARQTTPSFRPQQVLVETRSDFEDHLLQMFFTMMGCAGGKVEVADPRLIELLLETYPEVNGRICSTYDAPHLKDLALDIKCGNCEKVGPTLKRCACLHAYYCSTECQKLQWAAHKSDHKEALRKKSATNGMV